MPPEMTHWLINLFLTFMEVLRRLWQRITGRKAVPIPVRAHRFTPLSHPHLRSLADLRAPTPGTRRGRAR